MLEDSLLTSVEKPQNLIKIQKFIVDKMRTKIMKINFPKKKKTFHLGTFNCFRYYLSFNSNKI